MRELTIKFLYSIVATTTFVLLSAPPSYAIPPEGLEAFTLLTGGGKVSSPLYVMLGYDSPSWANSYTTFETYISTPVLHGNYFSIGGNDTVGNLLGDRDNYFFRYDQRFWSTQSVSFKLTHIDYKYIGAGKNILSLDYNAGFKLGSTVQLYILAGLFYRFTLNAWNSPTWSPFNFNTEDQEYDPEICFGSKFMLGAENFLTVDVNNRSPFNTENFDNVALDFTFNLVSGPAVIWRFISSTRFSGVSGATADIGEQAFLGGFIIAL